jgi:type III restriction enzyme
VPPEMLPDIRRAEIVITNYHAFQHRETLLYPRLRAASSKVTPPNPSKPPKPIPTC